jgi:hypothetical protein
MTITSRMMTWAWREVGGEKCIQHFGRRTGKEETGWKIVGVDGKILYCVLRIVVDVDWIYLIQNRYSDGL